MARFYGPWGRIPATSLLDSIEVSLLSIRKAFSGHRACATKNVSCCRYAARYEKAAHIYVKSVSAVGLHNSIYLRYLLCGNICNKAYLFVTYKSASRTTATVTESTLQLRHLQIQHVVVPTASSVEQGHGVETLTALRKTFNQTFVGFDTVRTCRIATLLPAYSDIDSAMSSLLATQIPKNTTTPCWNCSLALEPSAPFFGCAQCYCFVKLSKHFLPEPDYVTFGYLA